MCVYVCAHSGVCVCCSGVYIYVCVYVCAHSGVCVCSECVCAHVCVHVCSVMYVTLTLLLELQEYR